MEKKPETTEKKFRIKSYGKSELASLYMPEMFASAAGQRNLYGHTLRLPPSPLLPAARFRAVTLTRHTKVLASQLSLFR